MRHLLAYVGVTPAGTADFDLPAIQDQVATVQNGHYILQQEARVVASYAQGPNLARARINTPKLRGVALPYLPLVTQAATPGDIPSMNFNGDFPHVIAPIDETAVQVTNTGGAPETQYVGLFLELMTRGIPQGPMYTIRGTAAAAGTANVWSSTPITLDQTLPAGRYAIVGMSAVITNGIFCRIIFPGGGYRPGVVARGVIAQEDLGRFSHGRMGLYGEFESTAQPQIEFLAVGASGSQEVYFDVIRIR